MLATFDQSVAILARENAALLKSLEILKVWSLFNTSPQVSKIPRLNQGGEFCSTA